MKDSFSASTRPKSWAGFHRAMRYDEYGPVTIRFVDALEEVGHEVVVTPRGFAHFLSVLTDISATLSCHITDVEKPPTKYQGFTLSDGLWWYRIVNPKSKVMDSEGKETDLVSKGDWSELKTGADFDDLMDGAKAAGAWVDVEHAQQRARDHALSMPTQIEPHGSDPVLEPETAPEHTTPPNIEPDIETRLALALGRELLLIQPKPEPEPQTSTEQESTLSEPKPEPVPAPELAPTREQNAAPPVDPSPFTIWEQYRWPPHIVDGSIIYDIRREEEERREEAERNAEVQYQEIAAQEQYYQAQGQHCMYELQSDGVWCLVPVPRHLQDPE